ncbi:MAG: P-loop NTPase [Candidatus Syntropharchaeia archaeon]
MDPRPSIVDRRLEGIRRLIAVSGGKGGIGKSLTATVLALALSRSGYRTGLLDLDFSSPSAHVILGVEDVHPEEEMGIIPPQIHGIAFMSIVFFTRNNPSPLRGIDLSNAILELLANTRWENLDFLIIDMPPGIGDVMLDVIRWMKRIEFLVIATPSKLVLETVRKVMKMLRELSIPVIGVIENMKTRKSYVRDEIGSEISFLGEIDFCEDVEECIGNPERLLESEFGKKIREIIEKFPCGHS